MFLPALPIEREEIIAFQHADYELAVAAKRAANIAARDALEPSINVARQLAFEALIPMFRFNSAPAVKSRALPLSADNVRPLLKAVQK